MRLQLSRPHRLIHTKRSLFFFVWLILISLLMLAGARASTATAAIGIQSVDSAQSAPAVSAPERFTRQQRIGFKSGDDWEPAIATDRFGHTYALYKHYDVDGGQTCPGCDRHLLLQRSNDGGQTWTAPRPIAPGPVEGGQYDPQIAVDPIDGRTLYASFLQGSTSVIAVVKSTDWGQTWTAPTIVSTQEPGLDKDELAVRGNTIVVAYDDNFNTFMSISVDGGKHWASHLVFRGSNRFNLSLAANADIDSRGNIYISWDSFDQAHSANGDGPATVYLTESRDNGQTWERKVIDVSGPPYPCVDCGYAFLSSQMALRVGSDDTVYLLWNAQHNLSKPDPARIYFSRSTDHGSTFSPPVQVSDAPPGVEHCFPSLAVGRTAGDVRLGWMDKRTGAWNVFYRASKNGGSSLSPTLRISSYVPGYPYLTQAGFSLPYGDYFSMSVDADGHTQAAFGEGPSYQGPGNIWVSHSMDQ